MAYMLSVSVIGFKNESLKKTAVRKFIKFIEIH